MIPLIRLKKEVQFNVDLTRIIDALKGIAAARFYMLERQLNLSDRYQKASEALLSNIDFARATHPFARPTVKATGALMVTSTAGFLGGLNARVVSGGILQAGEGGVLTMVGERGLSVIGDARHSCTAFPGIEDASRFSLAVAVRDHLVRQAREGKFGRLVVVYPRAVSFSVQEVVAETLLPCTAWIPKSKQPIPANMLWESKPDEVIEYVITQWLAHRLDTIFAMSRLAEFSARAIHLEGSYQELLRQGKKIKQQYFRARHELIDRSMREIISAQLFCGRKDEDD